MNSTNRSLLKYLLTVLICLTFGNCSLLPLNPIQFPSVTTVSVNIMALDSAGIIGSISSDGGAKVTSKGFCWGTSPNPTIDLPTTIYEGSGNGSFTCTINNLTLNTIYYARAWAINSVGLSYGNQIIFSPSYSIGQKFGGGIIFYIDGTNQHGLIAATTDQSSGIQWYNNNYTSTGATGTAVGTGKANTNAIIASQGSGSYAASICKSYNGGGYNDWYLPSSGELSLLYQQDSTVGIYSYSYYWSSTEADMYDAEYMDFSYGYLETNDKSAICNVRAIRSF